MKARPSPSARCRAFLERLSLYIDDDLAGANRRRIEAHLEECPCCHEMADSLRRTVALCHRAGVKRLPPEVRARARARISMLIGRSRA
jgi:anti-sigma factor RsiW